MQFEKDSHETWSKVYNVNKLSKKTLAKYSSYKTYKFKVPSLI